MQIAKFSLVRAAERIATAKRKREDVDAETRAAEAAVAAAKTLTQSVSEIGDDRCVYCVYNQQLYGAPQSCFVGQPMTARSH